MLKRMFFYLVAFEVYVPQGESELKVKVISRCSFSETLPVFN